MSRCLLSTFWLSSDGVSHECIPANRPRREDDRLASQIESKGPSVRLRECTVEIVAEAIKEAGASNGCDKTKGNLMCGVPMVFHP